MFSIERSKVSFETPDGIWVQKKLSEMDRDELMQVCLSVIQSNEVLRAEKSSAILTMNKFLLKDHPEQFQKLLEKNFETDRI